MSQNCNISDNLFIIIYDGHCVYCNGWVKFLLKRNSDYYFTTLQGNTFQRLKQDGVQFPDVDSIIFIKNKTVFTQSKAAAEILIGLGSGWRLIGRFINMFPTKISNYIYDFIAKKRYKWFGKYENCPIPEQKERYRFLD